MTHELKLAFQRNRNLPRVNQRNFHAQNVLNEIYANRGITPTHSTPAKHHNHTYTTHIPDPTEQRTQKRPKCKEPKLVESKPRQAEIPKDISPSASTDLRKLFSRVEDALSQRNSHANRKHLPFNTQELERPSLNEGKKSMNNLPTMIATTETL
ncbi:hypothetical protein CHS0354_003893 [Potamilus streckersoni]|uniref:Uncharacterized protein n=1 Tax=Potamilus streckersoni TaxID=2493646 RepID=A0AAE0TES0_9BIVA|nr:hypothetical protein CHS0354_003893 [Potamilus streckersoni]